MSALIVNIDARFFVEFFFILSNLSVSRHSLRLLCHCRAGTQTADCIMQVAAHG